MPAFLSALGVLLVGAVIYYLSSPANKAEANIALNHEDAAVVNLEQVIHTENCVSYHGVALERQTNDVREMHMVICLRRHMMKQDTFGTTLTRISF